MQDEKNKIVSKVKVIKPSHVDDDVPEEKTEKVIDVNNFYDDLLNQVKAEGAEQVVDSLFELKA